MLVLLQHGNGSVFEQALRYAEPWHRAYCQRHGYEYRCLYGGPSTRDHSGTPIYWAKVSRHVEAMNSLADGDIVVWLDTDAVIVDPSVPLETALPDGADFAAVKNKVGVYNAGAMWTRVSNKARAYWNRVDAKGPQLVQGMKDQWTINSELGDMNAVALDARWNKYQGADGTFTPPEVIRAWHGYTPESSMMRVRETVAKLMGASNG